MKFWAPTKPLSFIDQVNRVGLATGSPRHAMAGSQSDFNGHYVAVSYRPQAIGGPRWVAEYTWGGRQVIARGTFAPVLSSALAFHELQGRGGCVVVRCEADEYTSAEDQARQCEAAGLAPFSKEAEEAHLATFRDWRWDAAAHRYRDPAHIGRLVNTDPAEVTREEFDAAQRERSQARTPQADKPPMSTATTTPSPLVHPFTRSGLGQAPFAFNGVEKKTYQACHGAPVQVGGACDHCGTGLMYLFHFTSADGNRFVVGCDCALKAGQREAKVASDWKRQHNREQAAARKVAARAKREAARKVRAITELRAQLKADPELAKALRCRHHIVRDMVGRAVTWGALSERQADFAKRLAREEAEKAATPELKAVEVPVAEGRQEITGRVLTLKWKESDYGPTLKMLVQVDHDGGAFKLWGTCPASLREDAERGDLVTFTAKLERSRDDVTFGFFKRPTKAQVVAEKEQA